MTTNKDALKVIAKTSINPKEIANAQSKVKEESKMATIKGYNTIEEVNAIIKEEAEAAGFTVYEDKLNGYGLLRINAENLNVFTEVSFDDHFDFDNLDNSYTIGKVSFRASVNNMGGNPTPDELMSMADEITECARLVARLNAIGLEFAKSFK